MKGNQTIKEFFIGVVETLQKEETDSVDAEFTFPDGTQVTFEISIKDIKKVKE